MMTIDKVINGLDCCKECTNEEPFQKCNECQYNTTVSVQECRAVLSKDALELIKELKNDLRVMFNRCESVSQGSVCGYCMIREKCKQMKGSADNG